MQSTSTQAKILWLMKNSIPQSRVIWHVIAAIYTYQFRKTHTFPLIWNVLLHLLSFQLCLLFFFLKRWNYIDVCSAWISRTSAESFFSQRRHKRLKNKIGLLLFYREHFYGFSESDIRKQNKFVIHLNTS